MKPKPRPPPDGWGSVAEERSCKGWGWEWPLCPHYPRDPACAPSPATSGFQLAAGVAVATGITIKGQEEPGGRGDKRQGLPSTPGTAGQGCGQCGLSLRPRPALSHSAGRRGTKASAPSPSRAPVSWGKRRGGWFSCRHRKQQRHAWTLPRWP